MHNDQLLENISETGETPQYRIADPEAAKVIFDRLWEADRTRRRNRAEAQAMFDGVPPYSEADLIATGQSDRSNINFGEGEALLESAMAGYVDLLSSVERLMTVKTRYGQPTERYDWEQIISEEATRMLRAWPRFTSSFLLLAHNFVGHGVGINYFDDEVDWRWKVSGLGDFLIPNRTFACEDEIEVAVCRRSYQVHQLYAFIRDKDIAESAGWNVEEVSKALLTASQNGAQSTFTDWEQLEARLKNNDLTVGYAAASEVKVLHLWNREFDGTISHTVTLEDASNKGFLCLRKSPFKSISQAFTIFTYGIGTNGYYHSIRGLGYKVFPHVQSINRLRCQLFDGSMLASSMLIQPESEDALNDLSLFYYGPYAVLPPKAKIVERAVPNLTQSALPMLHDLSQMIQNKTGSYQSQGAGSDNQQRTKFEIQTQVASGNKLSASALNLFYDPWQRHLREVMRRICRKNYIQGEPGGEEVARFRERCIIRGVPEDAIYAVDFEGVSAMRAIGAGSETNRLMAFEEFIQLMGAFDDAGRHNVLRDRVAARVGWEQVDRYVMPMDSSSRPPEAQKIAEMENSLMSMGQALEVLPNENHLVHARVHDKLIEQYMQQLDQGQVSLVDAVRPLAQLVNHNTEHVQRLSQDGTLHAEAGMLRKRLQQAGEFTYNGMEKLKKQQAQAQAQAQPPEAGQAEPAAAQSPQAAGGMDPALERQLIEHNAKLQMLKDAFDLKQFQKIAEFRQKQAIIDAEAANRMNRAGNFGLQG